MARREDTLIAQIEQDALNEAVPLAAALRKCVVLGGKSGSEALRDWATRELQGYHGEDDLPKYRVVVAPLLVDAVVGNYQVTRQPIGESSIPDFAREHISENLELRDGVGGLEALAQNSEIKLAPRSASDIVRYMNEETRAQNPYQNITHLYWGLSPAALRGVLDQIRTALTQLVAELRANMPRDQDVPSAEAANQALSVVVSGRRARVNVTAAQASGNQAAATVSSEAERPAEESRFWTRSRTIGAFLVGVVSLAAGVVALIEFF